MTRPAGKYDWFFDLIVLPLVLVTGAFSIFKKKP
jgi:hypothetical protein